MQSNNQKDNTNISNDNSIENKISTNPIFIIKDTQKYEFSEYQSNLDEDSFLKLIKNDDMISSINSKAFGLKYRTKFFTKDGRYK